MWKPLGISLTVPSGISRHGQGIQSGRPPAIPVPAEDLAGLANRPAADDTAEGALETVSTGAALALIATLPADQAEAVLLRTVLGLDAATAARVLGKRPGAVRTAAHRGLRTLARHLDQTRCPRSDANAGVTQPENLALRDMR